MFECGFFVRNMLGFIGMPKKNKKIDKRSKELTVIELKLFTPTDRKYPRFDYDDIKKEIGVSFFK